MKLCVHVCEQMCSSLKHMHACKCIAVLHYSTCLCVLICLCEHMCEVQLDGLRSPAGRAEAQTHVLI